MCCVPIYVKFVCPSRHDLRRVQVLHEGKLLVELDPHVEVLVLRVQLVVVLCAVAVLLPLVAPEAELLGVLVDVGPVGLEVPKDGLDGAGVEGGPAAEAGPDLAVLGGPKPVDGPDLGGCGKKDKAIP